jgi:hypothetical protein
VTYAAFVRNNGTHTTEAVKYHCWNDEAMAAMVAIMKEPWENLFHKIIYTEEHQNEAIETAFATITDLLSRVGGEHHRFETSLSLRGKDGINGA